MSLAFDKVKVYFKLAVMIAAALLVVIVIWYNRRHEVDVWFFGTIEDVNVLWLMLCTAVGTVVFWRLVRLTRHVIKDVHKVRAKKERSAQAKAPSGRDSPPAEKRHRHDA